MPVVSGQAKKEGQAGDTGTRKEHQPKSMDRHVKQTGDIAVNH